MKKALPVVCVLVSLTIGIEGANAYLTSETGTLHNCFILSCEPGTPRDIDCVIHEDVTEGGMKKNVYVTNTGTVDAYIRLYMSVNGVCRDDDGNEAFADVRPFSLFAAHTYSFENLESSGNTLRFTSVPSYASSGIVCGEYPDDLGGELSGWEECVGNMPSSSDSVSQILDGCNDQLGSVKSLAEYNGIEGYVLLSFLNRSFMTDDGSGGNLIFDGKKMGYDMSVDVHNAGGELAGVAGWIYDGEFFCWTRPLAPGESTEVLFDRVYVLGEPEEDELQGLSGDVSVSVSFAANAAASENAENCFDAFAFR